MDKVLILASVASMIDKFNIPNIELLKNMGYEVHVACNFKKGNSCPVDKVNELTMKLNELNVKYFQIDFDRNVFNVIQNIKAYKQTYILLKKNRYKFIHCHSPIGGVCGRIAAHRTKTKVIYTAHGFHFFKGAPLLNWLIYYPVELLLSRYTDVLININQEDYNRARKYFKAKKIEYIPGVGVNVNKFKETRVNRTEKRREIGVPEDAILLVSVGELNKNKNHETVIRAIAKLNNPNIYYLICGVGKLENKLHALVKDLGLEKQVKLIGYRTDIAEICKASDIFCFPSYREGLSVALMEAMAVGLPIVCSNIRGNVDLIKSGKGGFLVNPNDIDGYAEAISKLIKNKELCIEFGKYNIEAVKKYNLDVITDAMKKIYKQAYDNRGI